MSAQRAAMSVHIECLSIDGPAFTRVQRQQFERAFQGELTRLLAVPGVSAWSAGHTLAALPAPPVMGAAEAPAQLARQAAQSIFASLSSPDASSPRKV